MAKEELDRASISAGETAANVKQQDVALLLKKKNAVEQQAESTEAEAHVEQAAVVADQEALMVASADGVFASDGSYMVAQAGGTASDAGASGGGISTGTLLAIGGVALVAGGVAIAASDDDDKKSPEPTAISPAAASVNEGATAIFNVTGEPGATLNYVISGVSGADVVGGQLTGTVVIGADGTAVIAVQLANDDLTEGAETLTVTIDGVSASVTVNDSSVNQPQNLTSAVETVNGTDAADVFNGSVTAGALGPITGETLNAGDTINGLGGDDTLNIDFQGSPLGGGAILADVTTNSVETINVSFNTLSGGQGSAVDAVTFNDVENFNVILRAPNSDGGLNVINLSGALETLTLDGNDVNANIHDSDFALQVTAGAQPLTIDEVTVSDLFGSFDVDLNGLGNIPVLNLTNVSQANGGRVDVEVDASVGADSLTVNADDAGFVEFAGSSTTDVSVIDTDGDDVVENLTVSLTGNNNLFFSNTTVLETVTVTGAGEGRLSFSSDTSLVTIDASGLQGDLELSTLGNSNDMTITLGSGNDYVHSHLSGDVVVDTGAGNDWFEQHSAGAVTINMGTGNDLFVHSSSSEVTLDLGEGNDIYVASGNLSSDDTIVGGAGSDTLVIGAGDFNSTDLAGVSGFEVLATASNGTYDLDLLAGVTDFLVGGYDSYGFGPSWFHDPDANDEFNSVLNGGNVVLNNVAAAVSLTVNDDQASITLDRKVDTASNSLTVNIGNNFDSEAATASDSVTIGALIANDEETITLNSTGDDDGEAVADDLNVVTTLTGADLTTLVITGDTDLEVTNAIGAAALTKIDASAFTGDLTIAAAPASAQAVQFIGGSGIDTYNGTGFGDTVNGGAGNDVFNFDAANLAEDTLILEAGDALIDGLDVETYTGFNLAEDTIDLGVFNFAGSQASGLADQSALWADFNGGDIDATTVIADFFADTGVDRGVAIVNDNGGNTGTFVVIDVNKDGNFQGATDLVIFLDGVDGQALAVSDFGF